MGVVPGENLEALVRSVQVGAFAGKNNLHHCPVFDRLQYAKTEGEHLGDLVMVVCNVMIGRQTGGSARRRILRLFLSNNSRE